MIVDLFEFARHRQTASGETPLAALARVETSDRSGSLAWTARGSMAGRYGAPRLDLSVEGAVALVCQRCLQPMEQPVRIDARFLVAADEEAAESLDKDDDFDVVVGSTAFDIDALVEEEVILALPGAPRHRVCPDGTEVAARATKASPFAALAALKPAVRRDGDDGSGSHDGD